MNTFRHYIGWSGCLMESVPPPPLAWFCIVWRIVTQSLMMSMSVQIQCLGSSLVACVCIVHSLFSSRPSYVRDGSRHAHSPRCSTSLTKSSQQCRWFEVVCRKLQQARPCSVLHLQVPRGEKAWSCITSTLV